ncbi:hypothetical protein F3Y22_tig00003096pilonHSYRG00057 [Hibiscus syriacus]|uniref:BEACH domain-containing protein n=1 Tax=Hibiscus syriacus TaxID=106335 RepID=A0A6A3CRU3_HIBSY|nr:hypothetical protein F3Y22_tig00003096pilonHSYRG00057 [Hibiscus syriacus]
MRRSKFFYLRPLAFRRRKEALMTVVPSVVDGFYSHRRWALGPVALLEAFDGTWQRRSDVDIVEATAATACSLGYHNPRGKIAEFGSFEPSGWVWNVQTRRSLSDWELAQWMDLMSKLKDIQLSELVDDFLSWTASGDGLFSTKSCRSSLGPVLGSNNLWSKGIWLGFSPPRVEAFLWQLAHQKVAVKAELVKRGLPLGDDILCPLCKEKEESVHHLFISCVVVWELWNKLASFWDVSLVLPQDPHSILISWGELRVNSTIWKFIPGVIFWSIWKVRSAVVFEGSHLDRLALFFIVRFRLSKWFLAKFPKISIHEDVLIGNPSLADGVTPSKDKVCDVFRWIPPPVDFLKMNVDGAVRIDGSGGGIGGILRDCNGCTLLTFSENVSVGTPPLAELKAIKRVEWIQSPVLAPVFFSPLVYQISTLITGKVHSVRLIPRSCNGEADSLAKKGIENFYIDDSGCICEKESEDELSVIDQALGVKKDVAGSMDCQSKSTSSWDTTYKTLVGGRAWAYNGGAWGKEKWLPLLRPVAIELFSMDGYNDLLVFHKREREEVFKNLLAVNLPRNSMYVSTSLPVQLDTIISRSTKQEIYESGHFFKIMVKFSQGDGKMEKSAISNPKTFRNLDKTMGCQTPEGEEEFKSRYESWDDPEVPKFHYGSHYSSAGIVLFYLLRLPPFSAENQKLQGGQFDHADRLFSSIRGTWSSASGKGNTSDVKELIPEFFYMPEFLENQFSLDLGVKQSGEKVGDVILPPWAKGSAREFIRMHREALESDFVSENLHNWIDLIFGYKHRGKAAEKAANVFYHYTYEGSVDIDAVKDPSMKASILAQINHFGQTPKQLFLKPHIVSFQEKILIGKANTKLKPRMYAKYVAWSFPDLSVRFLSFDQDRLLSTHENLHLGNQTWCSGFSHDGHILVTGVDDGLVYVWRISEENPRASTRLVLKKVLCAHRSKITQLPEFPAPVSAVYVNNLTGEIMTAAGTMLAIWSINGCCLAVISTSQIPSDYILSSTSSTTSDWLDTNWYVTGHHDGAVKVWHMVHCTDIETISNSISIGTSGGLPLDKSPEYRLLPTRNTDYSAHDNMKSQSMQLG